MANYVLSPKQLKHHMQDRHCPVLVWRANKKITDAVEHYTKKKIEISFLCFVLEVVHQFCPHNIAIPRGMTQDKQSLTGIYSINPRREEKL